MPRISDLTNITEVTGPELLVVVDDPDAVGGTKNILVDDFATSIAVSTALTDAFAPTSEIASRIAGDAASVATAAAAAVSKSTLTTDGDILTRTAGVPARITRAQLANDAAFTSTFVPFLQPVASYTYNADGTVATSTESGFTSTYTYNADGTVNTITRDGITRTLSYNADGTVAGAA